MGSPLKIAIYNLGCRVNAYESFALADIARARGLEVVPWGEKAERRTKREGLSFLWHRL